MNSLKKQKFIENALLPLGLLGIGLALRLSLIGKGFYHPDTLILGIQAEKILTTGQMHYLHLVGYPLTALLGALFLKVGQLTGIANPALSINAMSVLFSSLTIAVVYFIVKKIADPLTAVLSTGLMIAHPVILAASVYGNTHAPALFFFFLGLYALLLYRDNNRQAPMLWFSAICAGLMAAARPQNLILLIPLSYIFFARPTRGSADETSPPKLKDYAIFLFLALSTCLIFFIPMIQSEQGFAGHKESFRVLLQKVLPNLDLLPLLISLQSILFSFTLLGPFLIVLGLFTVLRKNPRLFIFILSLSLPLWLFYGCFLTYVPRYTQATVIALTIPIGYFLANAMKKNRTMLFLSTIMYFFILTIMFTNIHPVLLFRHRHDLMQDFGLWVKKQALADSLIYCQDDSTIVGYYSGRKTRNPPLVKFAHRPYVPEDAQRLDAELKLLREILMKGTPVYATHSALTAYDPQNRFLNALRAEFRLKSIGDVVCEEWHQGITQLVLYRERLYQILLR